MAQEARVRRSASTRARSEPGNPFTLARPQNGSASFWRCLFPRRGPAAVFYPALASNSPCSVTQASNLQGVGQRRGEGDKHHFERRHPKAQLVSIHRVPVLFEGVLLVHRRDGCWYARHHVEDGVVPCRPRHDGAGYDVRGGVISRRAVRGVPPPGLGVDGPCEARHAAGGNMTCWRLGAWIRADRALRVQPLLDSAGVRGNQRFDYTRLVHKLASPPSTTRHTREDSPPDPESSPIPRAREVMENLVEDGNLAAAIPKDDGRQQV